MQSLLRWSIENTPSAGQSGGNGGQQPQPRQIDPEIINAIMGKPESELMKEALAVAVDTEKSEDDRLQALDNFEMLIENIDNANNIEKMGMWPSLQGLLLSPASSDELQAAVLWIIGTATQNNPTAQKAYLSLPDSPLSKILARLSPAESSSGTRSKAVYALGGLLKHNSHSVSLLDSGEGWEVLRSALQDPEITVRRKVVFLIGSLLLPSAPSSSSTAVAPADDTRMHGASIPNNNECAQPEHPNSHAGMTAESTDTASVTLSALQGRGIANDLVQCLVNPLPHGKDGDEEGDVDLEEKLVRLFYTYLASAGGKFDDAKKKQLSTWIMERRAKGDDWDLGAEELDTLENALR